MKLPTQKILIFDIETDSTDIDSAELKYFGAYSYIKGTRHYIKGASDESLEWIKEAVKNHDVIVGFNCKKFDIPILNKYGIVFVGKVIIDLWEVLSEPKLDMKTKVRTGGKGRGQFMGLRLNSWSLANIVKALNLGEYKTEGFDYSILRKNKWTQEEEASIIEYLAQDITITKRLFEYTNQFFYPLTDHLSDKNVNRFTYITASIASVAYKVMCHEAGLEEEYGEGESEEYEGGYVRYPTKKKHIGPVVAFDFRSLYPSIYRGFNLASPAPYTYTGSMFSGNSMFQIKGRYIGDKQGKIEQVLGKLFGLRKVYKANNDNREYLIKIIINAFYGITPKPTFKNVYSPHGAEDCTYIGRTMIKYAADMFNQRGFEVLYGDTDSVYVALHNKTKEEAIALANELTKHFLANMPFPHDDFGLALDAEIKAIFFFQNDDETFKKKNYIYIKKDDKIKIMGLPIIKSNASKIATTVLDKHLKKQILTKMDIEFPRKYLEQVIFYELEKDLGLAIQTYKVREATFYEKNPSSLYAQVAGKYGSGTFDLIPNDRIGVGKDKKYCTVEEFQENKLSVRSIDLSTTWSNLEPFIKNEQMTLGEY